MRWLPIGSWEPHGPHLSMDTDTVIACRLAELAAQPGDLVFPLFPSAFPGSIEPTGIR